MTEIIAEEQVILVDQDNHVLGLMPKLEAHQKGLLHRAISIIVFNNQGEMLIQQRALTKYHWAEIWSNTCCSHPRETESFEEAANRRLYEELGFHTSLVEAFHFIYKAYDEVSGLTEHEYDTVFIGEYNAAFNFNKEEVAAVRWIKPDKLIEEFNSKPEEFSFWFKIIVEEMIQRKLLNT